MEADLLNVPKEGLPLDDLDLALWAVSNLVQKPTGLATDHDSRSPPDSLLASIGTGYCMATLHEPMDHSQLLSIAVTSLGDAVSPSHNPTSSAETPELSKNAFSIDDLLADEQHHPSLHYPSTDDVLTIDPFTIENAASLFHEPSLGNSLQPLSQEGTALDQEQPSMSPACSSNPLRDDSWLGLLPDVPEGMESVDLLATHVSLW